MSRNGIKRRIYDDVVVNRVPLYTLFDTGAQNSYITREAVKKCNLTPQKFQVPLQRALGGEKHRITEYAVLQGTLHRLALHLQVYVVDELGADHEGKVIDVLFGILGMEQWGIEPDVKHKRLDLNHFTRELTEF